MWRIILALIALFILILFGYESIEKIQKRIRLREEREQLKRRREKLQYLKNKKEHFKKWRDWIYRKSVPIAGAFVMVSFVGITYVVGTAYGNIDTIQDFLSWTPVTEAILICVLWFKYKKVIELYYILNNLASTFRKLIYGKRLNIAEQIQSHVKEMSDINLRLKEIDTLLAA